MNTKILQKCIDELLKENPSKEYVVGILETVIAMNTPHEQLYKTSPVGIQPFPQNLPIAQNLPSEEEGANLAASYLRGGIGKI